MTNIAMVFTVWVQLATNPVPVGVTTNGYNFYEVIRTSTIQQYLPGGKGAWMNCSAMTHEGFVTNTFPGLTRTDLPLPPKERPHIQRILTSVDTPRRFTQLRALLENDQFADIANGGPDLANWALMFRTRFMTKTNRIYGLESSFDFVNWTLCPPEIDGTGEPDHFFDDYFLNQIRVYRIASREGVLPQ